MSAIALLNGDFIAILFAANSACHKKCHKEISRHKHFEINATNGINNLIYYNRGKHGSHVPTMATAVLHYSADLRKCNMFVYTTVIIC